VEPMSEIILKGGGGRTKVLYEEGKN